MFLQLDPRSGCGGGLDLPDGSTAGRHAGGDSDRTAGGGRETDSSGGQGDHGDQGGRGGS